LIFRTPEGRFANRLTLQGNAKALYGASPTHKTPDNMPPNLKTFYPTIHMTTASAVILVSDHPERIEACLNHVNQQTKPFDRVVLVPWKEETRHQARSEAMDLLNNKPSKWRNVPGSPDKDCRKANFGISCE
jgi:hypothetical protein